MDYLFLSDHFILVLYQELHLHFMVLDGCDRLFSFHPLRALPVGNIPECPLVCILFIFFLIFLFRQRAYPHISDYISTHFVIMVRQRESFKSAQVVLVVAGSRVLCIP